MEQFGKYQLVRLLGTGGMAEVFLARSSVAQGLAKLLVIKKIHPAFARSKHFVTMFVDEAKIALGLNHPNIVQVFDFGHVGQTYFLAMEHVEGMDLLRLLQEGAKVGKRVPYGLCAYIAQQVAKGLDYAHRKTDEYSEPLGIVHRDISPQNIIVSWDGGVKIVDFGIARARDVHEEEGVVKGKFAYMSPEQARGEPVDHRSDVFSAGIVLFELACARPLFTGKGKEVLELVKSGQIPRPREHDPELPRSLEDIILRALAFHRDDRFATARDLQNALGRFQQRWAAETDDLFDSGTLAQFVASIVTRERPVRVPAATLPPGAGSPGAAAAAAEASAAAAGAPLAAGSVHPPGPRTSGDTPAPGLAIAATPSADTTPGREPRTDPALRPQQPISMSSTPHGARRTPALGVPVSTPGSLTPIPPDSAVTPAGKRSAADIGVGPGGDTPPPGMHEVRERKHVLVLEGELTGLPSLRRRVGEARAAQTVAEFFRIAEHIAYKHEAHAHRISDPGGSGFAYVIGLPVAGEDDPSRAVRLALALVDALDGIGRDVEPELRLSVGIQRGVAIVHRHGAAWAYELASETTAIAGRLAREAQGGEVLVGGGVYRVARAEWNFEELSTIDLPDTTNDDSTPGGRDDGDADAAPRKARIYRLRGPKEREQRLRERGDGGTILGRELELKALRDAYRDALARREKRYVIIAADAGVGKRSLVSAFLATIPAGEATVLRAAARAVTSDSPYSIVADLARDMLGLAEGAEPREVQRRLQMAASMLYPDEEVSREVKGVLQMVGMLLGVKVPGAAVGEIDAEERRHRMLQALKRIEERLSQDKPLVIVTEDVHWSDPASWEVFSELIAMKTPQPIFGIATARPDERILQAASATGATLLMLGELPVVERENMVLRRFAPGEDAGELAHAIVAKAGGNPFFINEVVESLLERGILAEVSGTDSGVASGGVRLPQLRWVKRDAPVQVPASVELLVATRLDRLPAGEKETLTRAAVLGRAFSTADLEALYGRAAQVELDALARRQLLDIDISVAGGWLFRNEMTQQVAYDLLPIDERAALHRKAAARLSGSPGYRPGQDDARLARHLELAGETHTAARRYLSAATHALDVRGSSEAWGHLTRALKLLPRTAHEERYSAYAEREGILRTQARRPQQLREIHHMRREAEAMNDAARLAQALTRLAQLYLDVGRAPAARRTLGPALDAARKAGSRLAEAGVMRLQASLARSIGQNGEALELTSKALTLCGDDRAGLLERGQVLSIRGTTLWNMSRLREAIEAYAEALVIYRKLKVPRQEARALNNMGIVFAALGEFEEALTHYKRALKIDTELGDRVGIGLKLGNIGQAYLEVGSLGKAEQYLTKALMMARETKDPVSGTDATITLGQVMLRRGEPARARQLFERGLELASKNRNRYQEIRALCYLPLAQLRAGDPPEGALDLARSAVKLAKAAPMPVGVIYGLAVEALALSALGRVAEAADRAADGVIALETMENAEGADEILFIHARLAKAAGRATEARASLKRAHTEVQSKARRLRDPTLRMSYMASEPARDIVAEHAAEAGHLR